MLARKVEDELYSRSINIGLIGLKAMKYPQRKFSSVIWVGAKIYSLSTTSS